MTNRKRKALLDKINNLGETEHTEIYKIIIESGISHSSNNNGIFFNLTTLPRDILSKIEHFVDYCYENKEELDEYDRKLNECKYTNSLNTMVHNDAEHSHMMSGIREPTKGFSDWAEIMQNVDKDERINNFIEKIQNVDRFVSRRTSSKFMMAKKRFAKRAVYDNDSLHDSLDYDNYILASGQVQPKSTPSTLLKI
jgi:hypothetical protein